MNNQNDRVKPRARLNEDMLRRLLGDDYDRRQEQNMPESRCGQSEDGCGNRIADIPDRGDYNSNGNCGNEGCGQYGKWGLTDKPLAMVYAPLQQWRKLYSEEKGLSRGTLFEELDLPFLGSGGRLL